ncbi:hypothetical protein GJV85_08665 [Sulfurimonas aquatica]|uniref:Uncharacterized protein n=1 Tax=Sulfurimonas aquatica TaxID=2672570 RepID=A0A975B139_9BACT|nr:hypothetical protein [Sulfurimonas aquatica]QSZ42180.1 hypothetical protein GJV85_08665 [Sulfurimonas aquatica]
MELFEMQRRELAIRKKLFIYSEGVSEETLRLDFIGLDFISYYFLIWIKYSSKKYDRQNHLIQKIYGSEEKLLIKRKSLLEKIQAAVTSSLDIKKLQNRGFETDKNDMKLISLKKQYILAMYKMLEFEFGTGGYLLEIDYLAEFEEWKKDVKLNGLTKYMH